MRKQELLNKVQEVVKASRLDALSKSDAEIKLFVFAVNGLFTNRVVMELNKQLEGMGDNEEISDENAYIIIKNIVDHILANIDDVTEGIKDEENEVLVQMMGTIDLIKFVEYFEVE